MATPHCRGNEARCTIGLGGHGRTCPSGRARDVGLGVLAVGKDDRRVGSGQRERVAVEGDLGLGAEERRHPLVLLLQFGWAPDQRAAELTDVELAVGHVEVAEVRIATGRRRQLARLGKAERERRALDELVTRHRGRHVGGSGERGSRRRRTSGTVVIVVTATAGEDREGQREQPNRDGSHTRETVASCGRNPSEEPTIDSHYSPLEVEPRVLRHWDETRAFDRLRELRAEAPEFRFLDGPITANNPMGVHHAWGRTLKDAVIRFHAMQGQSCRYQNGFDCQGLWVEVEVERALGFQGKPDIEAFGLDNFSRACRERVDEYAQVIAEQSTRLGQWMDWDNSYFTYSDDNIEAIWYFLQKCFERKYLYEGHVPLPWCTRCGTSLSQHEMLGSYVETERPRRCT